MTDNLDNTIQQNASGPKRAGGDGISVDQHSLADQIAADKHLANKRARTRVSKSFTIAKIRPAGTA